jgi:hypothetical protein
MKHFAPKYLKILLHQLDVEIFVTNSPAGFKEGS